MLTVPRLAWLGVVCALLFAVIRFPAQTAFALLAPEGVGAFGVTGTVWNGRASMISAGDQVFRNTEWDLAEWSLLLGRLSGDFKTRWGDGYVEGTGSLSMGGTIRLGDTRAGFNAAMLQPLLGIPQVAGQVNVQLQELEIQNNWPHRLIGMGELRNFSSPLMGSNGADIIGDIAFDFDTATETDNDVITGSLSDIGGPLELIGTLLLTPPGNYNLKARLKARPDAPSALKNNLSFLGAPESDGTRIFQLAGSI